MLHSRQFVGIGYPKDSGIVPGGLVLVSKASPSPKYLPILRQLKTYAVRQTGEHDLIFSVIKQAVEDLFIEPPTYPERHPEMSRTYWNHKTNKYRERTEALRSANEFFQSTLFDAYAHCLGLDPDWVRRLLNEHNAITSQKPQ